MKALILVGGFGTRLRPLTQHLPKPLVKFCGLPMVEWQIKSLLKIGVTKIILAIGYKEDLMKKFMLEMKKKYNIEIICSVEKEPLNTGGPLKLAEKYLNPEKKFSKNQKKNKENLFFVFNSDVVCEYPLQEMIDLHLSHKGKATILVTKVSNPSRFGIVVHDQKGLVSKFIEKPKEFVGDFINAGMYIFDLDILEEIELKNISLERVIFPSLAERGLMYVKRLEGFWKDIGMPEDFLKATELLLGFLETKNDKGFDGFFLKKGGSGFKGINLVHENAVVEEGALVGPFCVLHDNVVVGQHSRIRKSVVMENCLVQRNSRIFESILMNDCVVGKWAGVRNCIFSDHVQVGEDCEVDGEKLLSGSKIE